MPSRNPELIPTTTAAEDGGRVSQTLVAHTQAILRSAENHHEANCLSRRAGEQGGSDTMNRVPLAVPTAATLRNHEEDALVEQLAPFASAVATLDAARGDPDAIEAMVRDPAYGDLMELLWKAAVRLRSGNAQPSDGALLARAARKLNICLTDLTVDLPAVGAAQVRGWVPTTAAGEIMGREPANKPEWFPDVKETETFLTQPYRALLEAIAPSHNKDDGVVRDGLRILAEIVRDWTDTQSGEVRTRLRGFAELVEPSGLDIEDFRELDEDAQRLVVAATEAIHGLALDADQFVADVRIDPSEAPWRDRARYWTLDRVADVGKLLEAIADSVDLFRDPEAWESTRALIIAAFGITSPGFAARAGGATSRMWYMPSLRELREGKTQAKRVISAGGSASTLGVLGVSGGISGRGMAAGVSPGWFAFTESDYWTETGFSIPGIFAFTIGRDRNYGPYMWIGIGKSVASLLEVVPGIGGAAAEFIKNEVPGVPYGAASVQWYHAGFDSIQRIVKTLATPVNNAITATKAAFSRFWRRISGRPDAKGQEANWPSDADWSKHRPHFERGELALKAARQVRASLDDVSPDDLVHSDDARALLGRDADKPMKTHRTITRYLDGAIATLERDTKRLREIADAFLSGSEINRSEVKTLVASIRRHYQAFAWIHQGLLGELLSSAHTARAAA